MFFSSLFLAQASQNNPAGGEGGHEKPMYTLGFLCDKVQGLVLSFNLGIKNIWDVYV